MDIELIDVDNDDSFNQTNPIFNQLLKDKDNDLDLNNSRNIPQTQCENDFEIQILMNNDCNHFLVKYRIYKFHNIIELVQSILMHFL